MMVTAVDIIAELATMATALELAQDGDGATVELGDGRELKYRTAPDECHDIMRGDDGDLFGRLEWEGRPNDYGHAPRPSGMDGRARKIHAGRGGDAIWWQPPADVTDEHLPALQSSLVDILEYGYQGVIVELLERVADSRGGEHRVVVADASLWGIEAMADHEYVASVIAELIAEVLGS